MEQVYRDLLSTAKQALEKTKFSASVSTEIPELMGA